MARPINDETVSAQKARSAKDQMATRLLELQYLKELGELIPLGVVKAHVEREYRVVSALLHGLGTKLAPVLVQSTSVEEIQGIIDDEIASILRELSTDHFQSAEPSADDDGVEGDADDGPADDPEATGKTLRQ